MSPTTFYLGARERAELAPSEPEQKLDQNGSESQRVAASRSESQRVAASRSEVPQRRQRRQRRQTYHVEGAEVPPRSHRCDRDGPEIAPSRTESQRGATETAETAEDQPDRVRERVHSVRTAVEGGWWVHPRDCRCAHAPSRQLRPRRCMSRCMSSTQSNSLTKCIDA